MKKVPFFIGIMLLFCMCSRQEAILWPLSSGASEKKLPSMEMLIFPNYAVEDLVIPVNIAPLNFILSASQLPQARIAQIRVYPTDTSEDASLTSLSVKLRRKNGYLHCQFPIKKWQACLQKAADGYITIQLYDRNHALIRHTENGDSIPFPFIRWKVSADPIDAYLVYRLSTHDEIPCKTLETEERCVENFEKRFLMDNRRTNGQCFNCHASAQNDAAYTCIHLRELNPGTLLFTDSCFRKIKLPAHYPSLYLSYPAWHPSKRFIAFSSGHIKTFLHINIYKSQDLIADTMGRLILYDLERNLLLPAPSDPTLAAAHNARYEVSFPVWAPDGQRIYFCRAEKLRFDDTLSLVENLARFRYHIAAMDFDTASCTFSLPYTVCVDSTYSLSLPAIDPGGRYLVVTKLLMGSFPSQNGGELALIDLNRRDSATGLCPLTDIPALSSPDGEKSHQFSSNGRWMVFGSKRLNGNMAALYFCYFDRDGHFHAPFVLPQENGEFYMQQLHTAIFPILNRQAAPFTLAEWAHAARGAAEPIDMRHFAADFQADGTSGPTRARAAGH